MNKDRWNEIEQIVDQALSIDTLDERTAFLSNRLAADEELRREVTSLLDSIEASQGLWDDLLASNEKLVADMTLSDALGSSEALNSLPEQIGPYRIKQLLGRGGMGNVYLAERINSDFHQNVALKVLQREVQNEEANRRFIQERKILSTLNHPNIAGLLDGGISEGGRPYFVMELVDGLPITEYCKKNDCSLHQRLDLFIQACQAVQYAHTNFIVHRDLKPDNLLVTPEGQVKILDFGIAKLIDRELSEDQLMQTQAGNRLLSLSFAAPEQITGDPITAATDVYALGLLLYELLTDLRPFNLKGKKLIDAEQIIRFKDPKKPSTLSERWENKIKGDLDAIILKALRKKPEDRYESASQLLEDIKSYKFNVPVRARKGTIRYKSKKFIKRNRVVLSAAMLFLFAGLLFTGYHIQQITKERIVAELEAEKAKRTTDFLIGVFEYSDPWRQPNAELTAQDILKHGTEYIKQKVTEEPEIRASLLSALGEIYLNLGYHNEAEPLIAESMTIEDSLALKGKRNQHDIANNLYKIGNLEVFRGHYSEAKLHLQKADSIYREINNNDDRAATLLELGWAEYLTANFENADSLYEVSLSLIENSTQNSHSLKERLLSNKGWLNHDKGLYKNADSLFQQTLVLNRQNYTNNHPRIARTLHSLAWVKYQLKDYSRARELLKEAINIRNKAYLDNPHPDVAWSLNNLGLVEQALGNLDEAERLFYEALKMRKKVLPEDHPHISQSLGNLGSLYYHREQYAKSAGIFEEVVAIQRKLLGSEHPNLAMYLNNLAIVLQKTDQIQKALPYHKEAISIQEKHFTNSHPSTIKMKGNLAYTYEILKDFEKAEKVRLENFTAIKDKIGIENEQSQTVLKNIIHLYEKWGNKQKEDEYRTLLVNNTLN